MTSEPSYDPYRERRKRAAEEMGRLQIGDNPEPDVLNKELDGAYCPGILYDDEPPSWHEHHAHHPYHR